MKGLELIRKAFALEEVERAPWVPFVGVHAAYLMGIDAESYLKSADLIVKGVSQAIETYRADGIPVLFDLQLEAEALGCGIVWAKENPPSVNVHPLTEGKSLDDLEPMDMSKGRIPVVMEATRRLRAAHPDIALYGLITGPFTLGLHLLGTEIFMKMFMEEDYVHRLMAYATDVCKSMIKAYKEAGCDIIAVVDPMTSQIGPDQFEQFVTPYVTEVFSYIKEQGMLSSFFVCGNAKHNIEVMCQTKPDNVSIDENIPLDYVRDICLAHNVSFGGNIKLTVALLMGSPEDCERDALECLDIGGKRGYILAPGCDLAYQTPVANLKAITDMIFDDYRKDIVRTLKGATLDVEPIDKKAYASSDKVIVDVITLDSDSCAPCQYMMNAIREAVATFDDRVTFEEHKVKTWDGVKFMVAMGVGNIPTICIDGNIEFVSIIPPVEQIKAAIQKRIDEKF